MNATYPTVEEQSKLDPARTVSPALNPELVRLTCEAWAITLRLAHYANKGHWKGDIEELMKRAAQWEKERIASGIGQDTSK